MYTPLGRRYFLGYGSLLALLYESRIYIYGFQVSITYDLIKWVVDVGPSIRPSVNNFVFVYLLRYHWADQVESS